MKFSLKRIKQELYKMDPKLDINSDEYKAALVLLGGLVVGANADRVAKFTKVPRSQVRGFAYNLRRNSVWKGSKTNANWDDKETGGTSFWMDACVALGWLEKGE